MDSTIFFGTLSSAAILIVLLVLYASIKPSSVNTNLVPQITAYSATQMPSSGNEESLPDVSAMVESSTAPAEIHANIQNVPPARAISAPTEVSSGEGVPVVNAEVRKTDASENVQEESAVHSEETHSVESSAPEISTPPTSFALPTDVSALSNMTSGQDMISDATSIKKLNFAYCVKCKSKKQIKDPFPIVMKNGRNAVRGLCPDCNTKIFKIGKIA